MVLLRDNIRLGATIDHADTKYDLIEHITISLEEKNTPQFVYKPYSRLLLKEA